MVVAIILAMSLVLPGLSALAPGAGASSGSRTDLGDGEAPSSRGPAKWTYMVYMSADNNLEDEAILNMNQMEAVGSDEDLNIVIQFDRSPEYDETNGNWSGTRRYLVDHDTDPDVLNSQLLEDMGEQDMGKGEVLRDFVVWAMTNYTAERYYLDIWGHGGGWREGTCNDYTSGSYISMLELRTALLGATGAVGRTLDAVGFDQCLMAQLEVYYEVKDLGDVLLGAETLIPSEGYNYTRVLDPLSSDPSMNATRLGAIITQAFFDEYGYDNERAHSTVDSEALDADLVPSVNHLAQVLKGVASSLHDEIRNARNYAQTYSITDYIDLGNFTERLLHFLPGNATAERAAAIEVRDAINRTVIAEGHGTGRNGSTGLSFYFPSFRVTWSYANIAMSQEQRWDDFLGAYFDDKDRPNAFPTVEVTEPHDGSVVGRRVRIRGTASDPDGNVTKVEWKFDRGLWSKGTAGSNWSVEASTEGLAPGLHRLSLRTRDDSGDYSREVHLTVNVEDRGLELALDPVEVRTYAGGSVSSEVNLSSFGEEGGTCALEVHTLPAGWQVQLPFTEVDIGGGGVAKGGVTLTVDPSTPKGVHRMVLRTYMKDAPLIQAFTTLTVTVVDRWPDLSVGPILIDPPEPLEGEAVNITCVVTNLGLAEAGPFDIELLHTITANGEPTPRILGRVHVGALPVDGFAPIRVPWTALLGTHMFTVVADALGNLSDLEPDDNVATRVLRLEGHGVAMEVEDPVRDTSPSAHEVFNITILNTGNLFDVITVEAEGPPGWVHKFNETAHALGPRENASVRLEVWVPPHATGGVTGRLNVKAVSYNDSSKFDEALVELTVPEYFGLRVTLDSEGLTLKPLEHGWFNLTVHNDGNGYENFTLEYEHQTQHLLVTAVNDTLEVAPGGNASTEVYVSSLGSTGGGSAFHLSFTVRSLDDPSTFDTVGFEVVLSRVFLLTSAIASDVEPIEPGDPVELDLALSFNGNYCTTIAVELLGAIELFGDGPPIGLLLEEGVGNGFCSTYPLRLPTQEVVTGTYMAMLRVYEVGGHPSNETHVNVSLEVLPVHGLRLLKTSNTTGPLEEGATWTAELLVTNAGNHPEPVWLNVSGVPGWMGVELSVEEVVLGPFAGTAVVVNVTITGETDAGSKLVSIVVTAASGNLTAAPPSVILDVPVEIQEGEEAGELWLAFVTFALLLVILAVIFWVLRNR